MAGIRNSNELRGIAASEWKADVGYLVKEFEIQKEKERVEKKNASKFAHRRPPQYRVELLDWIFGKRNTPR